MDMYTAFAITMVVTSAIGLLVTWLYLKHAMHEVECGRSVVDRMFRESESERAVRAKIQQVLADRIRILETYRVQHANRLNEQEDILSLLNEEAGRVYEASSVLQPFEVEIADHPESELFESEMCASSTSDAELHEFLRVRDVLPTFADIAARNITPMALGVACDDNIEFGARDDGEDCDFAEGCEVDRVDGECMRCGKRDTTVVTEEPLTDTERARLERVRADFIRHLNGM